MRAARAALLLFLALLSLLVLVPAAGGAAQQSAVTVQTALDRTHATVGDPIGLTISIRYPAGVQLDVSGIEQQFGDFEALSADPPVTQRNVDGTTTLRLAYRITAYKTGSLQFPALSIAYTAGGQRATARSQALPFTVDSVIGAGDPASDIHGLKPQIDLQVPASGASLQPRLIALAAAFALVVLLLVALIWRLLRARRLAVTPPAAPILPVSFEAEARAELDRIVGERLLARGDYRSHYARLAQCIRRYIARRYGFPATALTTAELEERMVRAGVGRWRARLVSGLLSECDAVHYAHYLPAPARAEADLEMAYEVVDLSWSQETRPEATASDLVTRT